MILDVNALAATVENVCLFLADVVKAHIICEAISETALVDTLISIPKQIKVNQ